jgi:hypothetical protein
MDSTKGQGNLAGEKAANSARHRRRKIKPWRNQAG